MARSSPGPDIATSEFGRDCLCWPGTGGRVRPSSTAHLSLLRASVRHTDAFPNSARLVRVSCLECVFRVHASVVSPV